MDQAQQLRNIIKANQVQTKTLTRVIAVTSGKGGVGKSNTAINLAIWFKNMGKRVIILDADFGLANIEIMFGAIPKYNLSDLVHRGMNISDIITWGPGGVGFISGGSGIADLSNLTKDNLAYIVRNLGQLEELADIVIVDTGAGISDSVLEFLVSSEEVLLVTTPEPTSITDSYSLLKALNRHVGFSSELTQVKIIANKVNKIEDGEALFHKLNMVVSKYLKIPITYLGAVPQDSNLVNAVMQQMPVSIQNLNAKSTHAFEKIAAKLMNAEELNQKKRGISSFFSNLIKDRK
ncbi:MAG: MinD/ParA family protein [Lachnospiraceae bacterium]